MTAVSLTLYSWQRSSRRAAVLPFPQNTHLISSASSSAVECAHTRATVARRPKLWGSDGVRPGSWLAHTLLDVIWTVRG